MSQQIRFEPSPLHKIVSEWAEHLPQDETIRTRIVEATITEVLRKLPAIDDNVSIEDTLFEAFQRVGQEKYAAIVAPTEEVSGGAAHLKSNDDLPRTVRPQAEPAAKARAS